MNALGEGKGSEGLNLATGKLVDTPKEFDRWSAAQQTKWSAQNGVDLVLSLVANARDADSKSLALVSQGLKLAPIDYEAWDHVTGKELHAAFVSNVLDDANASFDVCDRTPRHRLLRPEPAAADARLPDP